MSSSLVVQQLVIYPVKSCRGIAVESWDLDARGLRHDRRFMVVTSGGTFLTQRELPALCQIATSLDLAEQQLLLRRAGHGEIAVPLAPDGGAPIAVRIWGETVDARIVSSDVDAWLCAALGAPVRLVYFPDATHRATEAAYGEGFETGFADGFPVLILGQASLDDLNARLATPVPMDRFRPNVVVAGGAPFAEDAWRDVRCGDVTLRVVKPCDRCVITTTDQDTMARGPEPLRTLATFRRDDGKVLFGQNAVVIRGGRIRVGDGVAPSDR
jgi:uncharacterized protein YcbX